jgi:hypothetical protein
MADIGRWRWSKCEGSEMEVLVEDWYRTRLQYIYSTLNQSPEPVHRPPEAL